MIDPEPSPTRSIAPDEGDLVEEGQAFGRLFGRLFGAPSASLSLDRYELQHKLGAGGMGAVYAARDPELDRTVAIKIITQDPDADEATLAAARLRREAQAIARISHPNVVQVYDVGTHEQMRVPWDDESVIPAGVFVVMELVEGTTLRQWLRDRPRSWPEVVEVLLQAADGLSAVHREGFTHRDFKPGNVMVDAEGRVRVLDFGLASAGRSSSSAVVTAPEASGPFVLSATSTGPSLTETGMLMGTPRYMAPEQYLSASVDAAADQFALCVTLFEAVYGTLPYPEDSLKRALAAKSSGAIRWPARPAGPRALERAIERGLRPDPSARFASVAELRAELARIVGAHGRRRWTWLAGGALGLGVLGLSLQSLAPDSSSSPACAEATARIDPVWGDETKQRVEGAFAATGWEHASDTWARVRESLDHVLQRWERGYDEVCAVPVEQRDAGHDRTMRCLDAHLAQVQSLTELLAEGDRALAFRATALVDALPAPETCTRRDAPDAFPLPSEPDQAEAARALRSRLARVHQLETAGRYEPGLEAAQQALDEARNLGWGPVIAEAELRLGTMHQRLGHFEDAQTLIRASIDRATAGGADRLTASALLDLMEMLTKDQRRIDEALEMRPQIEAALARIDDPPELRAALYKVLATAADLRGDHEDAIASFDRALALQRAHPSSVPQSNVLATRSDRTTSLYVSRGPEAALAETEAVLAERERLLGPSHPDVAVSLNNLGPMLRAQGDLERAWQILRRAMEIIESAYGPEHHELIYITMNLANVAGQLDRPQEALQLYHRCESLMLANNDAEDPNLVYPLLGQADILNGAQGPLRDPARALELVARAELLVSDDSPVQIRSWVVFNKAKARYQLASTDTERHAALELARSARDGYAAIAAGRNSVMTIDEWIAKREGTLADSDP